MSTSEEKPAAAATDAAKKTDKKKRLRRLRGASQPKSNKPIRLYARAVFVGYRRSRTKQHSESAILRIEGVKNRRDARWYAGKRVAYIYKAPTKRNDSHYRVKWGKVTRPHGNSGAVRTSFKKNLPPKAMGARVRVMLYPSHI